MATGHSDYHRGDMEIAEQENTYDGFMDWTVYGGSALIVILLFFILLFAVKLAWFPSLIATFIVGVIIGMALKLKGGWYAFLAGTSFIGGLFCLVISSFV